MLETILFSIAMGCVGIVIVLSFLCSIPDGLLLWCARKRDKEWANLCDKYQADFLRLKHSGENTGWGI